MKVITEIGFFLCMLFLISDVSSRSINVETDREPIEATATWVDFQSRHVVSGTAPSTAAGWNTLLRERIGSQYGSKSINSFVVSTTDAILGDFSGSPQKYHSGTNLYWSTGSRRIWVMTLSGSSYLVYDCNRKYYVAGLNMNSKQPEHFEGQATIHGGNLDGATQGCTRIN